MQLVIGSTYESSRGFGRLLYLGETHGIDGYLPTFRTTKGEFKHYSYDQLPGALVEFASPTVSRADELIACLEGEIAKRDEVIVGLTNSRDFWREKAIAADDELAAIKAQEPVAYISGCYRDVIDGKSDRTPFGAELAFVNMGWIGQIPLYAAPSAPAADAGIVDMYRHLQKVTPYRFKKIQDASVTDGGDVMYFHKDRFDAAVLADMATHCAAKGVV